MSSASESVNSARLDEAVSALRSLSIKTLTGNLLVEYSVEGRVPQVAVGPTSTLEISEAMSVATKHELSAAPLGGGTRTRLGNAPDSFDLAIDMTRVDQLVAHNADDLTATVEAGMRVSRLQEILAEHGQFLAIDPPLPNQATVGGSLAVGWSGPVTWQNWSPRDIVIGMKTVQADGKITKSGGQVVKNVSGYDMARMHIGALGTLGIIVEVSFKLTPLPRQDATVMGLFESPANCLDAAQAVFGSNIVPLAISTLHEQPRRLNLSGSEAGMPSLLVRVGGRAKSVHRQTQDIISLYRQFGAVQATVLDGNAAAAMWRRIRDWGWGDQTEVVAGIRACVLPGDIPAVTDSLSDTEDSSGLRWRVTTQTAQGTVNILWLRVEGEPSSKHVRAVISETMEAVRRIGGTAVVTHAPTHVKESLDVWGEPTLTIDTMRNLKRQFDPNRLLNPGRFMGGI